MREMTEGHVDDETKLVIEWAPFRLASGATEASLLEASESLQREFLDRCAGFLRRELLCGTDGQWADLVYWSDEASAQAAARVVGDSPVCLRYFNLMVPHDAEHPEGGMLHLHRVRSYALAQHEPAGQ